VVCSPMRVGSGILRPRPLEPMVLSREDLHRRALRLEWLTTAWNVLEAAVALTAGVISGSVALIGFGIDSLIEVLSAVALLWRLLRAGPNASEEETGRAERTALLLVGLTFFLLGGYLAVEAISTLATASVPDTSTVGLILSVASLIAMPSLGYAKQVTARRLGSKAMAADAVETWVCAYLSAALLAGLGLHSLLGWWWADPVGALLMVPFVVWQGIRAMGEARENEDTPPGKGDVHDRG
jgi:cation diffusion facilitator family transporter